MERKYMIYGGIGLVALIVIIAIGYNLASEPEKPKPADKPVVPIE